MITCPVCHGVKDPAEQVGAVIVCGQCGMALVQDGAIIRRANAADVERLNPEELLTLRTASTLVTRGSLRQT